MAAPLDHNRSIIVPSSVPTGQQESQNSLEDQHAEGEGAALDQAAAGQLIASTARLSLSGPGDEGMVLPVPGGGPPAQTLAGIAEEWQAGISAATPATASGVVMQSAFVSSTGQPLYTSPPPYEEPSDAEMAEMASQRASPIQLLDLPNEVLFEILGYLEVCDLLATSRTSHHLRTLSLSHHLHHTRLRRTRALLPPLLTSPSRPSLSDLIRRSIVLSHTAFASRRLARSLASIRLARQLAARPSAETLVERCVLPAECLPCRPSSSKGVPVVPVAPALVARKRAVERERIKDRLRGWVGDVLRGEVVRREEGVRRWEERAGVGRVWRLRRFWERVARGEVE